MHDVQALLAISRKDLLQEVRSKAVTVATIFFSGVVLMVLAMALGPQPVFLQHASAGVLWVVLAFAGVISSAQSYQSEHEDGALTQLLLYPVPRGSIYLGKLLANWLYMTVLGLVILPITTVLFQVDLAKPLWLIATLALGALGFSLISTFYAALTANLRARESLLPVLMFPVVTPVLLACVRTTSEIVRRGDISTALDWLRLLAGFDLIYLVVCTAIFHYVVDN